MARQYRIEWTVETWHRARVWAESEDEARAMLWDGAVSQADDTAYGIEIQDSVLVVEDSYGLTPVE